MTSFKPIIFLYVLLFSPFAAATDIFDEYPTLFTHANGVSIAYQDMGTRDGFPVVLVMGLGAQLTYWGDPLVRALVEHGYRVVLLDNRDVGLSESYDYLGQPDMEGFMAGGPITLPYSLRDMADDVPALMTHLGINDAHIMGASMGGMIAQVMAIYHGDRVRSLTSLMSSTGAAHLPTVDVSTPDAPDPGDPRADHIEFGVRLLKMDGNNPAIFDEKYARHICARDYDRSHTAYGYMRQLMAVMASPDRVEQLKALTVPTLVIHGSHDPLLTLVHGEHTTETIPGARLQVIDGLGHHLEPVLVPEVVKTFTRFIDGIEAKSGN